VDVWLILRLDQRVGAQLDDERSVALLNDLFSEWLNQRIQQLLSGEAPSPLPLSLLEDAAVPASEI
jgi:hypothetical protein